MYFLHITISIKLTTLAQKCQKCQIVSFIFKKRKGILNIPCQGLGKNKEIYEVNNCRFTRASNHNCSLNKVHCTNHVYIDKYITKCKF